jgi:hypothetical protein
MVVDIQVLYFSVDRPTQADSQPRPEASIDWCQSISDTIVCSDTDSPELWVRSLASLLSKEVRPGARLHQRTLLSREALMSWMTLWKAHTESTRYAIWSDYELGRIWKYTKSSSQHQAGR